jgi:hypothetical protein
MNIPSNQAANQMETAIEQKPSQQARACKKENYISLETKTAIIKLARTATLELEHF